MSKSLVMTDIGKDKDQVHLVGFLEWVGLRSKPVCTGFDDHTGRIQYNSNE